MTNEIEYLFKFIGHLESLFHERESQLSLVPVFLVISAWFVFIIVVVGGSIAVHGDLSGSHLPI